MMNEPDFPNPPPDDPDEKLKIYFLPNLLTAGNLFCGFVALTKIVEADPLDAMTTSVRSSSRSRSFCSRAFLICSTGAWRAWAARKARSGANSIRWRT